MVAKVYSRTFEKAAELAGGRKQLARRLQVPGAELEKWIVGAAEPPIAVFLQAIDFVLDQTQPPAGSEPPDPAPPRDCATAASFLKDQP